ncbi:MAG: hypothetical protein ABIB43_01805 [archaeon]
MKSEISLEEKLGEAVEGILGLQSKVKIKMEKYGEDGRYSYSNTAHDMESCETDRYYVTVTNETFQAHYDGLWPGGEIIGETKYLHIYYMDKERTFPRIRDASGGHFEMQIGLLKKSYFHPEMRGFDYVQLKYLGEDKIEFAWAKEDGTLAHKQVFDIYEYDKR